MRDHDCGCGGASHGNGDEHERERVAHRGSDRANDHARDHDRGNVCENQHGEHVKRVELVVHVDENGKLEATGT